MRFFLKLPHDCLVPFGSFATAVTGGRLIDLACDCDSNIWVHFGETIVFVEFGFDNVYLKFAFERRRCRSSRGRLATHSELKPPRQLFVARFIYLLLIQKNS